MDGSSLVIDKFDCALQCERFDHQKRDSGSGETYGNIEETPLQSLWGKTFPFHVPSQRHEALSGNINVGICLNSI